jgi:hypothetical protein
MASRALMSGGLNIFGQLSQEGNEGDINLLSAGLGALTGAMTAPGTPGKAIGVDKFDQTIYARGTGAGSFQDFARSGIERFGADSAIGEIAKGGIKAADFMQAPGLLKYTAPVAQATGDLMFAQAKRDQDEYERMMDEQAENEYASDAARALAIRQSMEAYGFTEDEIEDAIAAAGYKKGGRVGFANGGDDTYQMYLDDLEAGIISPDKTFNEYLDDIAPDPDYDKVYKKGGRVGFRFGGIDAAIDEVEDESIKESVKMMADMPDMDLYLKENQ